MISKSELEAYTRAFDVSVLRAYERGVETGQSRGTRIKGVALWQAAHEYERGQTVEWCGTIYRCRLRHFGWEPNHAPVWDRYP